MLLCPRVSNYIALASALVPLLITMGVADIIGMYVDLCLYMHRLLHGFVWKVAAELCERDI